MHRAAKWIAYGRDHTKTCNSIQSKRRDTFFHYIPDCGQFFPTKTRIIFDFTQKPKFNIHMNKQFDMLKTKSHGMQSWEVFIVIKNRCFDQRVSPFLLLKLSYFQIETSWFHKARELEQYFHEEKLAWFNVYCYAQMTEENFLFYSSPFYFPCHSKYSHNFCLSDAVKKWKKHRKSFSLMENVIFLPWNDRRNSLEKRIQYHIQLSHSFLLDISFVLGELILIFSVIWITVICLSSKS